MALIRCEQCGKEISDTMNACPFCGKTFKKEDVSGSFHVEEIKAAENKPLMKEICTTVCGVMAVCVFLRLLLPVLYGNMFAPLLGTSFYIFIGGFCGRQNSILPLFFFILIGCGWMILWYYLRSKPSQKMAALGIAIAGLLIFNRCELCHSSRNESHSSRQFRTFGNHGEKWRVYSSSVFRRSIPVIILFRLSFCLWQETDNGNFTWGNLFAGFRDSPVYKIVGACWYFVFRIFWY